MSNPVPITFAPATIDNASLHLFLHGASGAGKTKTSLELMTGLVGEQGKIALVDTEGKRSKMYATQYKFDVVHIENFNPQIFVDCIQAAIRAGYQGIIVDSASHEWLAGVLEFVDSETMRSTSKNKFTEGWSKATPLHNRFIEAIVRCPIHIIVTARDKMEYVMTERNGKMVPEKAGLAPVQRDGFEYEFDVTAVMDKDHTLQITKAAGIFDELDGKSYPLPTSEIGKWLASKIAGVAIAPIPESSIIRKPATALPSSAPMRQSWAASNKLIELIANEIGYYGGVRPHIINALKKLGEEHKIELAMTNDEVFAIVQQHAKKEADQQAAQTNQN